MCYDSEIQSIQPQLIKFVKSRIFRPQDAEDIVQDTNRILINKREDYREDKNFQAWAFTIASFQIKRYLTDVKRCKIDPRPLDDPSYFFSEMENMDDSPLLIIENKEHKEKILNAISHSKKLLSEKQIRVLELISLGWKYREIADDLNISVGSVSAIKRRSVNKLKKFTGHIKLNDYSS